MTTGTALRARVPAALERATGYPGWAATGALSGLLLLGVAMVGLYWDVAWHVDFGRDKQLFTAPHVLILVALTGLIGVALATAAMATAEGATTGVRVGRWRVPWSALLLLVFRLGGLVAFVVDDLWHAAYGVDVTLWSPPHLGLLASGSLSAVALWLMLVEGGRSMERRPTRLGWALQALTLGSMLVAFSTYQGEFDYRVPLFSVLELPVLLAAAAGLALVPARIALGRGGAVVAAAVFLCLRGGVAALVGALGHTVPSVPLYLAAAVAVEAVAAVLGTGRRLRFAVTAGSVVGTVGVAGEWAWASAVGGHQLPPASWPVAALLALAAATGAAVLGGWLAQVVGGATTGIGRVAVTVGGMALVVGVLVPLARDVGRVEAVVALDRSSGLTRVSVELRPPDAADRASRFEVLAVQGGGTVHAPLDELGGGRYRTTAPVPVGGDWKTFVALSRGDEVMAAPVSLPADPAIGASAVPALPERSVAFDSVTTVLLREAHDGPAWPAMVAFLSLGTVFVVWLALLGRAVSRRGMLAAVGATDHRVEHGRLRGEEGYVWRRSGR